MNNGMNSLYIIQDIYDDFELNKRLKFMDYKSESIFWEYKNSIENQI